MIYNDKSKNLFGSIDKPKKLIYNNIVTYDFMK